MKQAATRVEDEEYELFQKTAASIGTTPSDALRIFIYSFNDYHGFPYYIRELLKTMPVTAGLDISAKVPECSRRSTCTLSTLISLNAVLAA